jgi:hypothetical protein
MRTGNIANNHSGDMTMYHESDCLIGKNVACVVSALRALDCCEFNVDTHHYLKWKDSVATLQGLLQQYAPERASKEQAGLRV